LAGRSVLRNCQEKLSLKGLDRLRSKVLRMDKQATRTSFHGFLHPIFFAEEDRGEQNQDFCIYGQPGFPCEG
jgi:hypothetical protein